MNIKVNALIGEFAVDIIYCDENYWHIRWKPILDEINLFTVLQWYNSIGQSMRACYNWMMSLKLYELYEPKFYTVLSRKTDNHVTLVSSSTPQCSVSLIISLANIYDLMCNGIYNCGLPSMFSSTLKLKSTIIPDNNNIL